MLKSSRENALLMAGAADDKKAFDILILDLRRALQGAVS